MLILHGPSFWWFGRVDIGDAFSEVVIIVSNLQHLLGIQINPQNLFMKYGTPYSRMPKGHIVDEAVRKAIDVLLMGHD